MGRFAFRWLKQPALHMAALGALFFGLGQQEGGIFGRPKPRLEIPAHRLEQMRQEFLADTGRPPSAEQWRQMIEMQVDDELLFQYALTLGMQENTAAQARLAQIAAFVEANPHESTEAENAKAAINLGLHEGDLVVRRILVDNARRLIRGVILLQQPAPEAVERFYEENAAEYTRPARVEISQLAINGFKWPDSEARARQLYERIGRENLSFEKALALADESLVEADLALQTEKSLAPRLGSDFAAAAMALPVGRWSEPIASRHGHHLVFVHRRLEAKLAPLGEVRQAVERQLLEKLADDWLASRLAELRHEFEIVVPGSEV
jgi:parvulin-like peptidyl-prolyl isomerase